MINDCALTMGLLIVGCYAEGSIEPVSIPLPSSRCVRKKRPDKVAVCQTACAHFISAISLAIYTATLSNHLNQTVPRNIDAVATSMGLPASSLVALAAAIRGSGSFDAVPGLTGNIRQAVTEPYRNAFVQAARTVFFVSLAFSGSALILSFFTTNNDASTADYVAAGMHGKAEEKQMKHAKEAEQLNGESSPSG